MNVTELKSANILLKRGVEISIPAPFFMRLFGKKTEDIVLRVPCMQCQIAIARKYIETGLKADDEMSLEEVLLQIAEKGEAVSEIIALAALNEHRECKEVKRLAKRLRKSLTMEETSYLFSLLVAFSGVQDFTNTIRLIQVTRITAPMNLSPTEKMS